MCTILFGLFVASGGNYVQRNKSKYICIQISSNALVAIVCNGKVGNTLQLTLKYFVVALGYRFVTTLILKLCQNFIFYAIIVDLVGNR